MRQLSTPALSLHKGSVDEHEKREVQDVLKTTDQPGPPPASEEVGSDAWEQRTGRSKPGAELSDRAKKLKAQLAASGRGLPSTLERARSMGVITEAQAGSAPQPAAPPAPADGESKGLFEQGGLLRWSNVERIGAAMTEILVPRVVAEEIPPSRLSRISAPDPNDAAPDGDGAGPGGGDDDDDDDGDDDEERGERISFLTLVPSRQPSTVAGAVPAAASSSSTPAPSAAAASTPSGTATKAATAASAAKAAQPTATSTEAEAPRKVTTHPQLQAHPQFERVPTHGAGAAQRRGSLMALRKSGTSVKDRMSAFEQRV